jgi:hypothetical protein
VRVREIGPVPYGRPLGRHVEHDDRSRGYRAPRAGELVSVRHERHHAVNDQGILGSCTGQALASAVACTPLWEPLTDLGVVPDRGFAEEVYSRATSLDEFDGQWPTEDTGSSGLAACKAAVERGVISGYRWAFGLDETLAALTLAPVMIGVAWYSSFDEPDDDGLVEVGARAYVRGGHEVCLTELDVERQLVWFDNSWGPTWGQSGRACMSWATLGRLLGEEGDAVVPVPVSEPAPVPEPVDDDRSWLVDAVKALIEALRGLLATLVDLLGRLVGR